MTEESRCLFELVHLPEADELIRVTGKESLAISRPCHGEACGWQGLGIGVDVDYLHLQLINDALLLQVPDLDGRGCGCAEPVSVGAEAQSIDDVVGLKGVQMLALVQVPQHGATILASGGTQGTIGGYRHAVQVIIVAVVVGLQLAIGQVPHLDNLVPASRNDDGVLVVRREANAGDPFAVTVILDGILAAAKGVPQLDGIVPGARDDLPIVCREGNAQHILGVPHKLLCCHPCAQVPKTQGFVPGA